MLEELHEKTQLAIRLLDSNELDDAYALIATVEDEANSLADDYESAVGRYYVSSPLIDIGAALKRQVHDLSWR